MFGKNGYPQTIFDKCVNLFLNTKFDPQTKPVEEDGVSLFISLPFIGQQSIIFARKIKTLFKKHYQIDLLCSFNTTKVRNYFSLKCNTPKSIKSKVIYLSVHVI